MNARLGAARGINEDVGSAQHVASAPHAALPLRLAQTLPLSGQFRPEPSRQIVVRRDRLARPLVHRGQVVLCRVSASAGPEAKAFSTLTSPFAVRSPGTRGRSNSRMAQVRGVPPGSFACRFCGILRALGSRRLDRSGQDRLKRQPQLILPVGQRPGRTGRGRLDPVKERERRPHDVSRAPGGHGGVAELELV
jgi:hypothetical protein